MSQKLSTNTIKQQSQWQLFLFLSFCEKSSEIVFYILSERFCVLLDAIFLICNNFVYFVLSKRTERYKVNATWVISCTTIGISNQNNAFVLAGKLAITSQLSWNNLIEITFFILFSRFRLLLSYTPSIYLSPYNYSNLNFDLSLRKDTINF